MCVLCSKTITVAKVAKVFRHPDSIRETAAYPESTTHNFCSGVVLVSVYSPLHKPSCVVGCLCVYTAGEQKKMVNARRRTLRSVTSQNRSQREFAPFATATPRPPRSQAARWQGPRVSGLSLHASSTPRRGLGAERSRKKSSRLQVKV